MPKNKIINKKNNIKEPEQHKTSLRDKFSEMLELPKEIVMNIPKLTIVGNGDMIIENYKGLVEYENARIRVNTGAGIIKITGTRLLIKEITSEDIIICGDIRGVEFIK